MKAQILKIAGVKSEKEFYKKYPTEEAFMKKHGKELQKAKPGAWIPGVGFDTDVQGISKVIKKNNQDTGLGMLANSAGSIVGLSQNIADKYGRKDKQLDQYAKIAGLAGKAAASAPQPPKQKYVRPEDYIIQPINPLGVQGFGYFEDGGEIQNTFAPNTIYTDMGYEPLNDSNPKQYADGGIMASLKNPANSSQFMSAAGSLGGGLGSLGAGNDFQQTEEGSLLSTIGGAAGTVFGGPIGGIIGSAAGGLLGGIVGGNKAQEQKRKMQNFKNQVASIGGTANIQNMIQGSAAVRNGGHIASYEDGGYMNPEYNPQVIAKFGDYTMDQLLAPPHDADMLRAGGHLKEYTPPSASAMYTGRDLPYQMEDGGQMAMGGDLQVHRGEAETMSYNPFLPDGGETVMFRGPSHDNGGMPISYGENGVEVEGGEPAIKLQDGGSPDGNLVVYGNMVIPDYGAAEIGDEKAKGKKFKHYIADLSKVEAKQNKLIDKTTTMLDSINGSDSFDQLALNTGQANMIGTTMKLKDIADKKKNAAAVQNAILDTAKEHGLESDALAKGKIKYAKANDPYAEFGAKLSKAQTGKFVPSKYDFEFERFIDKAIMLEQANSSESGDYRGGGSNYGTNNPAIKTPEQAKEFYYKNYWSLVKDLPRGLRTRALQMAINTGDPYGELLVAGKQMTPDQRRKAIDDAKKLGVTGLEKNKFIQSSRLRENKAKIEKIVKDYEKDPDTFLANLDAEQDRYYDSLVAANTKDGKAFGSINPDTLREFYDDYVGLAKNSAQPFVAGYGPTEDYDYSRMFGRRLSAAERQKRHEEFKKNDPIGYNKALNESNRQFTAEQRMKEGDVPYPTEFVYTPLDTTSTAAQPMQQTVAPVVQQNTLPQTSNQSIAPVESNIDSEDIIIENPNVRKKPVVIPNTSKYLPSDIAGENDYVPTQQDITNQFRITDFAPIVQQPGSQPSAKPGSKFKFPWEGAARFANSIAPFIVPSNQMDLEAAQLAPEIAALSDNTLEPVYAQTYQPQYTQPVSISYQDQMNANQSDFNALARQFGYSPELVNSLAANKYKANQQILGEQFRANQAEQQRARETNRETANDAQMRNMAIFQDQTGKMSQTKSILKQQQNVARNSIADKIAKNKLENRQLGIAENLYKFRYTPNGVAYNVNGLANFAPYGSGATSKGVKGQLAPGKAYSYDENDNIIGVHSVGKDENARNGKKISRNGSIVKAIKNL